MAGSVDPGFSLKLGFRQGPAGGLTRWEGGGGAPEAGPSGEGARVVRGVFRPDGMPPSFSSLSEGARALAPGWFRARRFRRSLLPYRSTDRL